MTFERKINVIPNALVLELIASKQNYILSLYTPVNKFINLLIRDNIVRRRRWTVSCWSWKTRHDVVIYIWKSTNWIRFFRVKNIFAYSWCPLEFLCLPKTRNTNLNPWTLRDIRDWKKSFLFSCFSESIIKTPKSASATNRFDPKNTSAIRVVFFLRCKIISCFVRSPTCIAIGIAKTP